MLFLRVNMGGYIEVSGGNVFAEDVCVLCFYCVSGSDAFSFPFHLHLQYEGAKRPTGLFPEILYTRSHLPLQPGRERRLRK